MVKDLYESLIKKCRKLLILNLSSFMCKKNLFNLSIFKLKSLFDIIEFKRISDANVFMKSGKPNGTAMVSFKTEAAMKEGLAKNGEDVQGRTLGVEIAREAAPKPKQNGFIC